MSAANYIGEERRAMTKSDVVKRGLLKLKASKVRGTVGDSARGPKSSKPVFLVFRSLHSGDKFLHVYTNEKKFHEADKPKWEVLLKDASSVYFLSDKKSFCVSMTDGGLLFMDCSSADDSEEWVRCLNAVLFAKSLREDGLLRYNVDMLPNGFFSHEGPSVLELSHCELIVWDRQITKEIVRWKLNHLRSFKAKNRTLTIVSGSRSCTGHKEFEFQSRHSVQITHTIETIVARVKYRSSPTMGTRNSQDNSATTAITRPLPQEPNLHTNIPNILDPIPSHDEGFVSSSVLASIPNFTPTEVYENSETSNGIDHGNHGRHAPGGVISSVPQRTTPPRSLPIVQDSDAQYDVIDTNPSKNSSSRLTTPVSKPTLTKNTFYESIDPPGMQETDRRDAMPPRVPPSRELANSPVVNRKPVFHQDAAGKQTKVLDTYEKLEHGNVAGLTNTGAEAPIHPEMYNSLHHVQTVLPEDTNYGELNYDKKAWESGVQGGSSTAMYRRMVSAPHLSGANKTSSSYSQIDGGDSSLVKVEGYELLQGDRKPVQRRRSQKNQPSEGESYGRLSHSPNEMDRSKPIPNPRPVKLLSPGNNASKGFNPYDTMPSDKRLSTNSASSVGSSALDDYDEVIEEESSTPIYSVATRRSERRNVRNESCSTMQGSPPPGYETLGKFSKMTDRSSKRESASPESSPTLTPERSLPVIPPRRASKRRYENIGPNGEVLMEKSPDPEDKADVKAEKPAKPPVPAKEIKPTAKPRSSSGPITTTPDGSDTVATASKSKAPHVSKISQTSVEDTKPQVAPKPKVKPRPKNTETKS